MLCEQKVIHLRTHVEMAASGSAGGRWRRGDVREPEGFSLTLGFAFTPPVGQGTVTSSKDNAKEGHGQTFKLLLLTLTTASICPWLQDAATTRHTFYSKAAVGFCKFLLTALLVPLIHLSCSRH